MRPPPADWQLPPGVDRGLWDYLHDPGVARGYDASLAGTPLFDIDRHILQSNLYGVDENWVFLSRDILTIPKRWLVDFQAPDTERFSWPATILGWGLVCTIFALTVLLAVYRRDRTRVVEGPGAAFLKIRH